MTPVNETKLAKILALLDGAATEGEAIAALNRATSLLEGTGLTLEEFRDQYGDQADEHPEEVEIKVGEGKIYIPGSKFLLWRFHAASVCVDVAGIDIIYRGNVTHIAGKPFVPLVCVGTQEALAAAAELLQRLLNNTFSNIIADFKQSPEYLAVGGRYRRNLTSDFTLGFWSALAGRAVRERKARENEGRLRLEEAQTKSLPSASETCTALVLASDTIRSRTTALMRSEATRIKSSMRLGRAGSFRPSVRNHSAYVNGRAASNGVSLSTSRTKLIS